MPVYMINDKSLIAPLFQGWNDTMVWSCLDDCMGAAYADNLEKPKSAQIINGGFCFFAGEVCLPLISNRAGNSFEVMTPPNREWENAIEAVYGDKVNRYTRFSTVKDINAFNKSKLTAMINALPKGFEIKKIDRQLYRQIMESGWAVDLCYNFGSEDNFIENGLGFVALEGKEIVSGASSYTYYREGIEIEIDTREDKRRLGLAAACGARLILECLSRNKYPAWDAQNPASIALAKKLGYSVYKEYPVYVFK